MPSAPSTLLDHFRQPRNAGPLAGATGSGTAQNAACGDVVRLDVRVENGRIADARFLAQGCPASIGAASLLTTVAIGLDVAAARALDPRRLLDEAGESRAEQEHGMSLAVRALGLALGKA